MFLQRKLRACYAGDEKYRPEQMPKEKYLPVIGWDTKRRLKNNGQKAEYVDEPYLVIIGNNGRPIEVVMFNCKVMIDDKSEVDMVALSQMARNITIIGKALCEKISGVRNSGDTEQVQEETGTKPEQGAAEPV
jgi:hypothetical protein